MSEGGGLISISSATAAKDSIDKPRYRVSFETAADSPEELHKRLVKGLGRHLKRKPGRKMRR